MQQIVLGPWWYLWELGVGSLQVALGVESGRKGFTAVDNGSPFALRVVEFEAAGFEELKQWWAVKGFIKAIT